MTAVDAEIWWLTPLLMVVLVGLVCPATGALLVTQRRVLQANLMAHAVLPGLVLALALGLDPILGGLISGLLGSLLAEVLSHRCSGREESVLNTVLAGFLALGVLLAPLLQLRIDLEALLFGDLLAVGPADLVRMLVAAAVLAVLVLSSYRNLVFVGVDAAGAEAARLPVRRLKLVLTFTTGLVVISSMAAVGVVLVIALLCAPVLMHIEASRSLQRLMLRAAATGLLLGVGGLLAAVLVDAPPGALIGVLCLGLLVFKRPLPTTS
ncbi:metal ABC transporter permease [Synechococcus sp. RSCCF101]|uniref:metal ABC transporter permease n=1 Tax=Synechococcus sp. RSCCF101 TaxID=2511069 RepID=UPI001248E9C8|nr:metal ABC transporter permease [Synechococcus sp. RSCCF101]QEY31506.1 metal ABC transporter permease [Synechococcus sp. RSCCF101]